MSACEVGGPFYDPQQVQAWERASGTWLAGLTSRLSARQQAVELCDPGSFYSHEAAVRGQIAPGGPFYNPQAAAAAVSCGGGAGRT